VVKKVQGEAATGTAWWPQRPLRANGHGSRWERVLSARAGVQLAFGLAVGILLLVGWTLYGALERTRDAAGSVNHTHRVLLALGDARETFRQMESAQRGYLLSGAELYLRERDQAAQEFRRSMGRIASLVADNPAQAMRLRQLELLAQERIRIAVANADLRRTLGFSSAWPEESQLTAVQAAARVYAFSRDMEDEELRLLQERQAQEERHQRDVILVLAAALAVGLLLLAPAYGAVLYQSRRRESTERQMADLVQALPVTVWQIRRDAQGQRAFTFVGASAAQARGLTVQQVRGDIRNVYNSVLDEDREGLLAAMDEAERTLGDFDREYRVRMPDGGERWIHSRATLQRDTDGATLWSGYWADVTAAKRLQHELERSREALESFTYSVSHDLRAPLAAIDGFSRALQERAAATLDDRSGHFLQRIRAGTLQMHELIEGMLQLGKVSAASLEAGPVDLSALAQAVLADLQEREPARRVHATVEPGLSAWGDERLLRQVLANLLGNAWKFTSKAESAGIALGSTINGGRRCFFVSDNGAGFDMAHAHRLFGSFHRLHAAHEFPGTGIGLATVQRIVERHGGEVWAEAQPGEGATFYFALPRRGT
jgi:signal transduction histidine kinase